MSQNNSSIQLIRYCFLIIKKINFVTWLFELYYTSKLPRA